MPPKPKIKPAPPVLVTVHYRGTERLVLEHGDKRWTWTRAKSTQFILKSVWDDIKVRPVVARQLLLGELVEA